MHRQVFLFAHHQVMVNDGVAGMDFVYSAIEGEDRCGVFRRLVLCNRIDN